LEAAAALTRHLKQQHPDASKDDLAARLTLTLIIKRPPMNDLDIAKAALNSAIDQMELTVDDILLLTALATSFWISHPAAMFQQLQASCAEPPEADDQPWL